MEIMQQVKAGAGSHYGPHQLISVSLTLHVSERCIQTPRSAPLVVIATAAHQSEDTAMLLRLQQDDFTALCGLYLVSRCITIFYASSVLIEETSIQGQPVY